MADRWLIVIGVVALTSAAALAQQGEVDRFERQLERVQRQTRYQADPSVPAEQRTLIDFGGYTTINFLTLDGPDNDNHVLRQYDLNGFGHLNLDGVHDFFLRGRTSYRDFNENDSFDGKGDTWQKPTLDRGVYRFDLQRAFQAYEGRTLPGNVVIQGGRQLVHWASGLVLSEDIDGGQFDFTYDIYTLRVLAGTTRESDIDFDTSRPDFEHHTRRGFYGALFSAQATPQHKPFIYGLIQDDHNNHGPFMIDPDGPIGVADPVSTRFRYDSVYVGVGSDGQISDRLLYGVEIVYEGGKSASNSVNPITGEAITQTDDAISAGAGDAHLDYLLADANRSRISGELILATGDTDRNETSNTLMGNKPHTPDHAFNAMGLLNTGLAFSPNVSNLLALRGGASTFPLPTNRFFQRLQVGVDLFVFNKLNNHAPIDEPTTSSGYLGFETDLYANWQITSDLSLALRYGLFLPGDAIPSSEARNFFYTGLTFSF